MEHTGRTLCVPLRCSGNGMGYIGCPQFRHFRDSSRESDYWANRYTAVKRSGSLPAFFRLCLR